MQHERGHRVMCLRQIEALHFHEASTMPLAPLPIPPGLYSDGFLSSDENTRS